VFSGRGLPFSVPSPGSSGALSIHLEGISLPLNAPSWRLYEKIEAGNGIGNAQVFFKKIDRSTFEVNSKRVNFIAAGSPSFQHQAGGIWELVDSIFAQSRNRDFHFECPPSSVLVKL
jgi:hypothetical protein